MSSSRGSPAVPLELEVVSPELALVDPVLAAAARASLEALPRPTRAGPQAAGAQVVPAAAPAHVPHSPARRSWRLHAGVAVAAVLALLLLDVRVEVGRTPADANLPPQAQTAEPPREAPAQARPKQAPTSAGPARTPTTRRLAWAPTEGASGYHVELFRGNDRVFAADTKQPQIAIPARWVLKQRRYTLREGTYRWFVWPVVSGRQASSATVQAVLTIAR